MKSNKKSKLPPYEIPCKNDGTEVCNLGYACDGCPFVDVNDPLVDVKL